MSNMSYCRFRNTLSDLRDCYYALKEGVPLSGDELDAKDDLLRLCSDITQRNENGEFFGNNETLDEE